MGRSLWPANSGLVIQPRAAKYAPPLSRFTLFVGILVCLLEFLHPSLARTQVHVPGSVPPAAPVTQTEGPKDALGRTTPRGTVLGFLYAARKGDNDLAAEYLNTRLRGKAAADLAHQLFVVLDRRLPPRLNELSDSPEGSLPDPRNGNQDLVGRISSENGDVDVFVERVDRGESGFLWLFSPKTLDAIPDLYQEVNLVSVDEVLPEFLVNTRIVDIALFEWLAVFVGVPLFYFLTVLMNRMFRRLAGLLRRRLYRNPDLPNPELLPPPVRLLLLAFAIHWVSSKLSLPLLARQFWSGVATAIVIAASVWLLILLNRRAEEYIRRRLRSGHLSIAPSMTRLIRSGIDLLLIFVGVLVALHHWGIKATAALAGLGVGGIAVALAAQKTLENVMGGMSLIFDQALHIGDFLKVGDVLGIVEDIGLRSVRIRTLDRSMISIPNGQISNMSLEILSSRDKFWFHPILALKYGTTSQQMHNVLERIRNLLVETLYIESNSIRVRFLHFGPSSLDVEVFAYVLARDWTQFLEIQEGLLLRIMESIESAGVQIALPSQRIFLAAASTADEARGHELANATSSDEKPSDEIAAVKSA